MARECGAAGAATDLAQSLVNSGYAGLVIDRLARQACQIVDAEGSCVLVRDRGIPNQAIAVAGCGRGEEAVGDRVADVDVLAGPGGWPGRADAEREMQSPNRDSGCVRATVPIQREGQVCGVLSAQASERRAFGDRDLGLLSEVARLAGAALLHAERRGDLLPLVGPRVAALVAQIDARDGYTAEHSRTVVDLSRAVGERLFLDPVDMLELELAALFHDLGKVAVAEEILTKPAALDPEEQGLMRAHVEAGATTLASVPGLEAVATIVRHHHERWDGRGYPAGIAGRRIPVASRIVAACDAYDAMTTNRPYRTALSAQRAVRELWSGAGSQFDPAIVDLLVSVVDERGAVDQTRASERPTRDRRLVALREALRRDVPSEERRLSPNRATSEAAGR